MRTARRERQQGRGALPRAPAATLGEEGQVVKRRSGLFYETCTETGWLKNGTWTDEPVERKLTKAELAEAYRIWVVHGDIRTGQVKA